MWKLASGYFLSLHLFFSLSLFLSSPFPPTKLYCQIRAQLRLPLTHSAIFSQCFFFRRQCSVVVVIVSLRRVVPLFSSWRGRDQRAAQGGHLAEQFVDGSSYNRWLHDGRRLDRVYIRSLKFLGNANARREDTEGIQRCGNCVSRYEICRRATLLGWSVVLPSFVWVKATGGWYRKPKNIFIAGTHVRFLTWSMSSHWDWLRYQTQVYEIRTPGEA